MGIRKALFVLAIAVVPLLGSTLGDRQAGAATASQKRSAAKARLLDRERHGGTSDVSVSSGSGVAPLAGPDDCGDGTIEAPETCDPPGIPAGAPNQCRFNCTFCGDGTLNQTIELLTNGDFELGTLSGWTVNNLAGGDGTFMTDTPGTMTPESGNATTANALGGSTYAVSDMDGPGTQALEQSFTVPLGTTRVDLSFQMFVNDWSGTPSVNPGGLNHNLMPNQHARVDLLSAGSSAFATGAPPVLANFFLGTTAGSSPHPYVTYNFNITAFTTPGGTYDLRFAGVENQFHLNVGVDNVKVTATIETCDDGNNVNNDGCASNCRLECGNGTLQPVEECDDGNLNNGDGCSALCMNEASVPISCGFISSGATIVREGVDVDRYTLTAPAGSPVGIDVDAELLGSTLDGVLGAFTSDGSPLGVSDDDAAPFEPDSVDPYLLVTAPSNGIVDIRVTAFNDLDFNGGADHTSSGPYTLSVSCSPLICGNQVVQPPETCDPPQVPPTQPDSCRSNCTFCGDGALDAAFEECDDDNNLSNDGCGPTCALEFCGDGTVQSGESCEPAITSVALFRNAEPWGSTSIQDLLTAHGIPYGLFTSADIGVVSLASYDKVVIASAQSPSFYAAVSANAAWFNAFVAGGGVLEFHGATHFENDWSALSMPAGLTIAPQDPNTADDALTIVSPGSWLVSAPNAIAPGQVDGWGFSTHGYFTGAGGPFATIIREDEHQQPVLIEMESGAGCVIATMMTVEWVGADPEVLENLLLRNCASSCRDDCTTCGDGNLEAAFEECDDGGTANGDGCSATCEIEVAVCGNSVVEGTEQCDPPGPLSDGSTCCAAHGAPGCTDPVCESAVCHLDPSCCSGDWSAACVALADANPECVTGCASTGVCGTSCCLDSDGDGTCDTADSCPLSPNPGGEPARFDLTMHAIDPVTFGWSKTRNVDWVRGDMASIGVYGIIGGVSTAAGVQTIPAPETPAEGGIFYWLVKPDCAPSSWSTGSASECAEPGVCPPGGRDGSLPLP